MVTRSPRLTPIDLSTLAKMFTSRRIAIGDSVCLSTRIVGLPDDGDLVAALLQVPVDAIGRDVERTVLEPFDRYVGIGEGRVRDAGTGPDPVNPFPCSPQNVSGSLIDASYMARYIASSIKVGSAILGVP